MYMYALWKQSNGVHGKALKQVTDLNLVYQTFLSNVNNMHACTQ